MPITVPMDVNICHFCPIKAWSSHPPKVCIFTYPSDVTYLTIKPTSSMWAEIITFGAPLGPTRSAINEPIPSVLNLSVYGANSSSIRFLTSCSKPDGPGISDNSINKDARSLIVLFLFVNCDGNYITLCYGSMNKDIIYSL